MKILIFCLCFFINGSITIILRKNGIWLGFIPTFIFTMLTFWVAKKLGDAWENWRYKRTQSNSYGKESKAEEAKTPDCEKSPNVVVPCEASSVEKAEVQEPALEPIQTKRDITMTLGNKINSLRTERGLSQKELATLINVTTGAIAEWESDDSVPSLMELARLSKALNVSSDVLLESASGEVPAPVARKKKKSKTIALIVTPVVLIVILAGVLFVAVIAPKQKYSKAENLFAAGNYSQAYNLYAKLGDYEDSVEKSKECLYIQAVAYRNDKNWDAANPLFEQIADYKDSAALIHYHDYALVDSKNATCSTSGYQAYKCDCGDEYTDTIVAGHNYSSATCTAAKKCSRCGQTEGSALGHTDEAKCSRCGIITFQPLTYSGTGGRDIDLINLPKGKYMITISCTSQRSEGLWIDLEDGLPSEIFVCSSNSTIHETITVTKEVIDGAINITTSPARTYPDWTITIEAI